MLEKDLLGEMARAKAEIQSSQLWVDGARTNRIWWRSFFQNLFPNLSNFIDWWAFSSLISLFISC